MKGERIKTYIKGRRYEYIIKKDLEESGYLVIRSAGSHSPFDLIAIPINSEGSIRAIQVKTGKLSYSQILEILSKMPKIGSENVRIIREVAKVEKGVILTLGLANWRGFGLVWCDKEKEFKKEIIN